MTTTRRAPKKYDDARRTRVTPEWENWDTERRRIAAEDGPDIAASLGHDPSTYFPEQYGRAIPDEGCWILVVEEPLTELRDRFRVPPLSMWRARRHELSSCSLTVHGVEFAAQQAVIATPGGDLHLWPQEYVVAEHPMELATDPDAELRSLGGEPVLDEEELFYLMSRGIGRHQALMLLFKEISSLDFVYVVFPEWVTDALAGIGQSLCSHIARHPRSA